MTKRAKRTTYGVDGVRKRMIGIQDLILEGSVLAIDPSCISVSSKTGYAWYVAGELESSGTVDGIDPRLPLERRLQLLGKYCREEFEEPDVLAIEHIVPGGRFGATIPSTIRAAGAIIGSFECEHVISVVPLAWQSFVLKYLNLEGGTDYLKYKEYKSKVKSDEEDAKWIGRCILEIARGIRCD